jgi:predicted dehydrogenase
VATLGDHSDFELCAVCDRYAVDVPVPWTDDLTALVHEPSVQAVFVATPPETHAEIAAHALLAGKHVFVEKPLCTTLAQARKLLDLAGRGGARLMVGHLLCYHPAVRGISRWLERGAQQRPCLVRVQRHSEPGARPRCPWWTLAPHDLALLQRWFGEPLRVSVRRVGDGAEIDAHLHYAGDVQAQLSFSTTARRKVRRVELSSVSSRIVFDDLAEHKLSLHEAGRTRPIAVSSDRALDEELRHFAHALRTGQRFETPVEQGVDVVYALTLGQSSLEQGGAFIEFGSERARMGL